MTKNILLLAVLLPLAAVARAQSVPADSDQPAGVTVAASAVVASPSLDFSAPAGDMTLGGVPQLIAQKLQEAKAAAFVDFAGHIGGGAYVPTYVFHDKAGTQYVEAADIGYRAIDKSKPSVYLMPIAVNLTALSARAWDFQWARDHVTRSPYPDIWVGVGPLIPTDQAQFRALKLNHPKDYMAGSVSCRFGK